MAVGALELGLIAALVMMFFGGAVLAFVMAQVTNQEQGKRAARVEANKRPRSNPALPLIVAGIGVLVAVLGLAAFVEYVLFG